MTTATSGDLFGPPHPAAPDASPSAKPAEQAALAGVIGSQAHRYLRGGPLVHWPALLVPLPWLFYRKMYLESFAFLGIILALEAVYPPGLVSAVVALSIVGHPLYRSFCRRRIRKADRRRLAPAARDAYLARAGGVSWAGAVFGTVLTTALLTPLVVPALSGRVLP